MKAAYYENFKESLKVGTLSDPEPNKQGAVIKVEATGICRSDWHGWQGHASEIKLPHVPGHEFAGIVEAIGKDVKNFKIGDRVTTPFVNGCGSCEQCNKGNHHICDNQTQPGFTHWGSFAEYVLVNHADVNLVRLPDEMDFTTAASLGCRFATSYRAVVFQGKGSADQWLVVHGCGGVGLSAIMIGKSIGAKVIGVDIADDKLKFAKSIGADVTINGLNNNKVSNEILEITTGGAHVSIDAIGNETTALNSILSLRKKGKHIQVGLIKKNGGNVNVPLDLLIEKESEVIGSHGLQAHHYNEMLKLIIEEKLKPQNLIQKTVDLNEGIKILQNMDRFGELGIAVINDFS